MHTGVHLFCIHYNFWRGRGITAFCVGSLNINTVTVLYIFSLSVFLPCWWINVFNTYYTTLYASGEPVNYSRRCDHTEALPKWVGELTPEKFPFSRPVIIIMTNSVALHQTVWECRQDMWKRETCADWTDIHHEALHIYAQKTLRARHIMLVPVTMAFWKGLLICTTCHTWRWPRYDQCVQYFSQIRKSYFQVVLIFPNSRPV